MTITKKTLASAFSTGRLFNLTSLFLIIASLSVVPALYGLRGLLPVWAQNALYAELLRHPSMNEFNSIAFIVILNLGREICVIAFTANLIFVFRRGVPMWLKVATTLLVVAAIFGAYHVTSSVIVFP